MSGFASMVAIARLAFLKMIASESWPRLGEVMDGALSSRMHLDWSSAQAILGEGAVFRWPAVPMEIAVA